MLVRQMLYPYILSAALLMEQLLFSISMRWRRAECRAFVFHFSGMPFVPISVHAVRKAAAIHFPLEYRRRVAYVTAEGSDTFVRLVSWTFIHNSSYISIKRFLHMSELESWKEREPCQLLGSLLYL